MAEPRTPQDRIDDASASLDDRDHRRLARVERSLARGRALRAWWQAKTGKWAQEHDGYELAKIVDAGVHPDCFHLILPLPHWEGTRANYGFFDTAPIDGRDRPVMGIVQQTFFDAPQRHLIEGARDPQAALERWRNGLREFVLRYLIRLTGLHEIVPYVDPDRRPIEPWLRPFSWCPSEREQRRGFGFSQLYYKRRDTGRVGKFRDSDRARIDLRTLDDEFEWIVVGIRIHDLHLRHPAAPSFNLSIEDQVLAVASRDFVLDGDDPGFGYTVLEDPAEEGSAILWQRPTFGFQLNQFIVREDGRVLGRVTMVADKLPRLAAFSPWVWGSKLADRLSLGLFTPAWSLGLRMVDGLTPGLFSRGLRQLREVVGGRFDPISASATFLDLATMGLASKELCVSRDTILRSLLFDFVRSQQSTIIATRGVWRAIPDWTDEEALPDWVKV